MTVGPAAWRHTDRPVTAHAVAQGLLDQRRYAHTRGVAQQAARLARLDRLAGDDRRVLLCAAWLHEIGAALGDGFAPLLAARALRAAGQERLARIVAHQGGAAMRAALLDLPPIGRELPAPHGGDAAMVELLDIAAITTGPAGERSDPLRRLREMAGGVPADRQAVRTLVAVVDRLGREPRTRALLERVVPPGSGAARR